MIRRANSNIYVKGFDQNATNNELYNLFKDYGSIFSSKLALTYNRTPKGYGFVQFTNPTTANKAISKAGGQVHKGVTLTVEHYQRQNIVPIIDTIYVKNLPKGIKTKEDLNRLFSRYGPHECVYMQECKRGFNLGYCGLIHFNNVNDAMAAQEGMNGKLIDGIRLYVCRALSREKREIEKRQAFVDYKSKIKKQTIRITAKPGYFLDKNYLDNRYSKYGIQKLTILKNGIIGKFNRY